MVEANYLFCQKSITLQDVHFDQSESKDLANTPLHLPVSLNDFYFFFLQQHTQIHTHTHPAEQDTQGWQTRSSVICQPPPGGNIKDRPHKCVSVFVCRCVFVHVPAKLGVAVMLYGLIKQLIRNLVWCFLASTWGGVEWSGGRGGSRGEEKETKKFGGDSERATQRAEITIWIHLNTLFRFFLIILAVATETSPGCHMCVNTLSHSLKFTVERDF